MNTMTSRWMKAALAAGLCLLLTGCGDKVEPPEAYVIGENSTVPLDQFLDEEEGGKLTAIDAPESEEEENEDGDAEKKDDEKDKDKEDKDEKDSKDKKDDKNDKEKEDDKDNKNKDDKEADEEDSESADGEADVDPNAYTYTYKEVPAAALDRYAAALVDEAEGFTVIDEERVPQTDLPDFEETEGSAVFAREAAEEGSLFQIAVSWTEKECSVVVSCPEGGFYDESESSESENDGTQIMTLLEVVDYVRSLHPSALGLEGESMSEYELVPVQGSPLVDGEVCRHLNVYQLDPVAGTNNFVGAYLVGIGKVYSLNPVDHTVEKIL